MAPLGLTWPLGFGDAEQHGRFAAHLINKFTSSAAALRPINQGPIKVYSRSYLALSGGMGCFAALAVSKRPEAARAQLAQWGGVWAV